MIFLFLAENIVTLEGALLAAVGALATSTMFLFKRVDREIDRCDRDRRQLWERIVALEQLTCTQPNCPARMMIRSMGPVVPGVPGNHTQQPSQSPNA